MSLSHRHYPVLVTGAAGLLGHALGPRLAASAPGPDALHLTDLAELDVTDPAAVADAVRAVRPHTVFHLAAWTDVDAAETHPGEARRLNVEAAETVARAAAQAGALVVHMSTDFVFDGDKGPNTGGMGAYSPAPVITEAQAARIEREIIIPIVHAMNAEDRRYKGVVYAGLMMTDDGPRVLEFNVRFGDPETQPILVRLQGDIVPALRAIAEGNLQEVKLDWDPRPAVCVVMASGGYPGSYEKGKVVTGLEEVAAMDDVVVFHAGTAVKDGKVVTAGGRVLGVTGKSDDIQGAIARAYEAVEKIHFDGAHCRTDIGAKALRHIA